MTTPSTSSQTDTSLTRDLIYAARYYLGRPRALMVLATIAIVTGLVFNWNWLVAAGLAPILLSTLPCLVMCGLGICMMCRSGEKRSAPVRNMNEPTTPATMLVRDEAEPETPLTPILAAADNPSTGVEGCCRAPMSEAASPQTIDLQPNEERK